MNDKVKKGMIIAGCVVCCIVLVVMIASNFKGPAKTKDKLAESQSTEIEVKPDIKKSELDKKPKETDSKKEESKKEPETTEGQPESEEGKEGDQDNGQPVQNIQPRVTKPETPDQEVLKNPKSLYAAALRRRHGKLPHTISSIQTFGIRHASMHNLKNQNAVFLKQAVNAVSGVSVSGLEMTQNSIKLGWSSEEVDEKLKSIMKNIHEACVKYGTEPDGYVNYVKGANVAGFMKVAKAMMAQGFV